MEKIFQTIKHDPDNKIFGNCFQACIASIFEVSLKEVPHFAHDGASDFIVENRLKNWLRRYDLETLMLPLRGSLNDILFAAKLYFPHNYYYILTGINKSGCRHSIICQNDKIVHNPSKDENSKIIKPCEDDNFWIHLIIKKQYPLDLKEVNTDFHNFLDMVIDNS